MGCPLSNAPLIVEQARAKIPGHSWPWLMKTHPDAERLTLGAVTHYCGAGVG
jgi:hypothetical protein